MAIWGYLLLIAFVFLLMRNKVTPIVPFILLPIVVALLAGYDLRTIEEYTANGMTAVTSSAFMSTFAILFFAIMSEAGLFDPIVNSLLRHLGKSGAGVCIAVVLVSIVAHLDGSPTTTIILVMPLFMPVFKKIHLDPRILVLLCGLTQGIMGLMPWAGTLLRLSVTTGQPAGDLWRKMLPLQLVGLVVILCMAAFYGRKIQLNGPLATSIDDSSDNKKGSVPHWKMVINAALTILVFLILAFTKYTSYIVFMASACIALVLNYSEQKSQNEIIKKTSSVAFPMLATMMAAGVFIGILGSGEPSILSSMADPILNHLPVAITSHMHLILAIVGPIFGLLLTGNVYLYGLLPLFVEVGLQYGVPAEAVGFIIAIGDSVVNIGSPVYPFTFLILGMAGVELKDYLKFAIVPMYITQTAMILAGILIGIIPL